ncbi:hypothetical protein AB0451_24440 [Streptomyces sp. NPDC052000]|uniref:hypothetical protein n=1 Tax=Streptomyces sp. NPDC052000 TaxID=3155676 RepID=UPI00344E2C49
MHSPVVFSVLSDDRAVAETVIDSGVLSQIPAGIVHVNLATVSAGLARRGRRADGHGAEDWAVIAEQQPR